MINITRGILLRLAPRAQIQPRETRGNNTRTEQGVTVVASNSIELRGIPNRSLTPAVALGVDELQETATEPPQEEIAADPRTPDIPHGITMPPVVVGESRNIQDHNRTIRDLKRDIKWLYRLLLCFGFIATVHLIFDLRKD